MGILEEQDRELNKKRKAKGLPETRFNYDILQSDKAISELTAKYIREGGNIARAFDDAQRLEEAVEEALRDRNMEELVDISKGKLEALDMSVSSVPDEKRREAEKLAGEAVREEKEEERTSGGITFEEVSLEDLKKSISPEKDDREQ